MDTFTFEQESIYGIILNAPSEHDKETWLEFEKILSEQEKSFMAGLRFPKRQRDWLLGRFTAKELLLKLPHFASTYPLHQLTIANDPQGAPYILLPDHTIMKGCLSISHTNGAALCAWTSLTTQHIGSDIELIAPHPQYFIEDYFTPFEITQCVQAPEPFRADLVTAIWSAKEAVLKTLQQGLKWDTRQVEINLSMINLDQIKFGIWYPAEVTLPKYEKKTWQLWIQRRQVYMLTLACLKETTAVKPEVKTGGRH